MPILGMQFIVTQWFVPVNILTRPLLYKDLCMAGVVPTRHWDTCGSNPGIGGIFFLSLALFCYTLLFARSITVLRSSIPV